MPWGKKSTLHTEGAVSAKCAREMAKGGCKAARQTYVSICYWSGRPQGVERYTVGTGFMGCCCNGKTVVKEFHFTGNRSRIREQAAAQALTLIRDCVLDQTEENNR